jgi:hypothetical protein
MATPSPIFYDADDSAIAAPASPVRARSPQPQPVDFDFRGSLAYSFTAPVMADT